MKADNPCDCIPHPERHACEVLIERLSKELSEVEQQRADMSHTLYMLRRMHRKLVAEGAVCAGGDQ